MEEASLLVKRCLGRGFPTPSGALAELKVNSEALALTSLLADEGEAKSQLAEEFLAMVRRRGLAQGATTTSAAVSFAGLYVD